MVSSTLDFEQYLGACVLALRSGYTNINAIIVIEAIDVEHCDAPQMHRLSNRVPRLSSSHLAIHAGDTQFKDPGKGPSLFDGK